MLFYCTKCHRLFDETVVVEGEVCPVCGKGRIRRVRDLEMENEV